MLLLLLLFYIILPRKISSLEEDECQRFCPEDVKAAVFFRRLEERVTFLQKTLTAAIDGLELLQEKTGEMPDAMREKAGMEKLEIRKVDIDMMRALQNDLLEHLIRADTRAWNRIIDTYRDMVDKSRSPKAPKDLPDLRIEIENLQKTVKESEESFEPFLEELGRSLSSIYKSLIVVVEGLVKAGGKEMVLKMMQQKVDNLMGKVLLQLVENKTQDQVTPLPPVMGDIAKLAEKLNWDFYALGLKVKQADFWQMELKILEDYLDHIKLPEDKEDKDIKFITALIEKYNN